MKYEAMVIGVSAGGVDALNKILPQLPSSLSIPVFVVMHIGKFSIAHFVRQLNTISKVKVLEANSGEKILAGQVYFAPPNYHLLVECNKTLSLCLDDLINFSRPSIDILFESAADIYREKLIGVLLTGANNDGAIGMKRIKEYRGLTIVQDPTDAFIGEMPRSAMALSPIDLIYSLEEIGNFFHRINEVINP
jgi:two-component system, chemotaxis family, protein-glutamate methylesterase/glutaminase